jgi:hypothetical protein
MSVECLFSIIPLPALSPRATAAPRDLRSSAHVFEFQRAELPRARRHLEAVPVM